MSPTTPKAVSALTTSKPITLLQLTTHPEDFERNLRRLCQAIDACQPGSIVMSPEVCLTGYPYERMEEAAAIADSAINQMIALSSDKTVTLTTIVKEKGHYYNRTFVMHQGRIIHEQDKIRLFLLGDEDRYFAAGEEQKMRLFDIDGIKTGLMVCFELRYTEFWLRLRGADLIMVPARWGLPRKEHLTVLPAALALSNQCYCAVANSADEDMAKSSALYGPGGAIVRDDYAEAIRGEIDLRTVRKVRRHIRMGVFD